ncbi:FecR family protein [Pedobacter nototheniae]|uniref:FecR family protein n=1 Tax=Pedobacter nototheniae TaxID=2488994 RepID=UPI00292EE7CE|nr:FecR family protein [Pedobacter nototheniae]
MDYKEEKKALIRKYINGNSTAGETAELKKLMSEYDLSMLFDEVMDELSSAGNPLNDEPNADAALVRFKDKLPKKNTEAQQPFQAQHKLIKHDLRLYLSYAAAILVVFGSISFFMLARLNQAPVQVTTAYEYFENANGKRSKILLPDQSVVYLGAGSKLSFPARFAAQTREINLTGEAFFEVTKNPKKPFIIHTGNIVTRVLGTSFKVDAFLNKPLSVLVSTGKVRVDREVNKKLQPIAVLLPGEAVTWNEQLQTKEFKNVSVTDIKDWKNGKLVFRKTKLADITTILERWYNADIKINSTAIAERQIRVNLTTDVPLRKLIKILSVTGNFKYQINNNHVVIF